MFVALLVGITACGPSRSSAGGGSSTQISRSEIVAVPDRSAYTLIRLLRPRWLTARIKATPGNPTPAYAHVYLDQLSYGPLASLYDISSNTIDEIHYISTLDATTLYGTGYVGGVIHVFTRTGR